MKHGEERFSSSWSWLPGFGECAYYTGETEIRLKHGLPKKKKKKKSRIKNRLSCFTESPADETSSNFNSDRNHNSQTGKEGLLCLKSADTQNETGNLFILKKKKTISRQRLFSKGKKICGLEIMMS